MVSACADLKHMDYARKVFDRIPGPNVPLWNAMFRGYAKSGRNREALLLFCAMNSGDVTPNCFTYPVVIKSCVKTDALLEGEEIHCALIKNGFRANSYVGTSLIDMYANGRVITAAYRVFAEMSEKNVIAWTSMINAYISCQDIVSARILFDLAPERDVVLWNIVVSGYIKLGDMKNARSLFDKMPKRDVMCWNTMMNGYAKNGDVEACEKLFGEIPEKNIFSWNALIGGYAHSGRFLEVLSSFKMMLDEKIVPPNDATLVNMLTACARLGALDLGKWTHIYADSVGYKRNVFVGNALIDMYAKCGVIESAIDVFKNMASKDIISWNSIICGLAMHGRGNEALNYFSQMKNSREKPDNITYVGVLSACAHLGLVENGLSYFQSMIDEHIVPHIEHYGCIVDLLARAGHFDQAMNFVTKMPFEADAVIWAALLGACKTYKNVDLAEVALEQLIQLEPNNPANYVVLSNIYSDLGRWKDVARVKVAMRETGFKKLPACSLIEARGSVVEFYSLDERHPETEKIYNALAGLTKLIKPFVCALDIEELTLS